MTPLGIWNLLLKHLEKLNICCVGLHYNLTAASNKRHKQKTSCLKQTIDWLVVSTHLKNIIQFGSFPQVEVKIKNTLKPPVSWTFPKDPGYCWWFRNPKQPPGNGDKTLKIMGQTDKLPSSTGAGFQPSTVCPKKGIISTILFWGWDLDHQSYDFSGWVWILRDWHQVVVSRHCDFVEIRLHRSSWNRRCTSTVILALVGARWPTQGSGIFSSSPIVLHGTAEI